jgi:hypothetical protein
LTFLKWKIGSKEALKRYLPAGTRSRASVDGRVARDFRNAAVESWTPDGSAPGMGAGAGLAAAPCLVCQAAKRPVPNAPSMKCRLCNSPSMHPHDPKVERTSRKPSSGIPSWMRSHVRFALGTLALNARLDAQDFRLPAFR